MKKIFSFTFCSWMLLCLVGFKVDLEVWVDKTGAGKGTMLLSGVAIFDQADFRAKLAQIGIEATSIAEKGMDTYESEIKWQDFNKAFGTRTVNEDGSIFLDFGIVEIGSITAHVDGQIIREKTRGNIRDNSTVVFTSGRGHLVYMPKKIPSIASVVFLVVGILAIVLMTVFCMLRNVRMPHDFTDVNDFGLG